MIAFGSDSRGSRSMPPWPRGPVTSRGRLPAGEPKRVVVDGVAERSVAGLLARFPVLVFTPDRIRLVQAGPALRRT